MNLNKEQIKNAVLWFFAVVISPIAVKYGMSETDINFWGQMAAQVLPMVILGAWQIWDNRNSKLVIKVPDTVPGTTVTVDPLAAPQSVVNKAMSNDNNGVEIK